MMIHSYQFDTWGPFAIYLKVSGTLKYHVPTFLDFTLFNLRRFL